MATRLPPLLEPYLSLPPEFSLTLLTGVLGATTNWLLLRHLAAYLGRHPSQGGGSAEEGEDAGSSEAYVLLISFMRDITFWREGAARLGLDLGRLGAQGRFRFLDGLTGSFRNSASGEGQGEKPPRDISAVSGATPADVLGRAKECIAHLRRKDADRARIVVILDQPDMYLACGDDVPSSKMQDMLLELREDIWAMVVTVSADEPLMTAQSTALEKDHATLVMSLAHEADTVMSLRLLDTGAASDVSGVLRITRGGGTEALDRRVDEHELLYFVGSDESVRVFHRGQ